MKAWQLLLGSIIFVYVLQMTIPGFTESFYFSNPIEQPWVFVTSCFLHGGIMHLFFNSFALLMFGPYLEREIGTKNLLILFLLAGTVGNLTYFLTIVAGIIPAIPALGASGGIFGILGALAIIKPNMKIFMFFIPMSIQTAAIVWFVMELLGSFSASSGIASAAHLGGLLIGIIWGVYFRNRKKRIDFDPGDFGLYEEYNEKQF